MTGDPRDWPLAVQPSRPQMAVIDEDPDVRTCPGCGCSEQYACTGGCSWVVGDDRCSACIQMWLDPA